MKGDPVISEALSGRLPGAFLVFDGPDGSGKSTQLTRFLEAVERWGAEGNDGRAPIEVEHVREPGGTWVGEEIREVLLHKKDHAGDGGIAIETEMLLFMASRAELCRRRIAPARAAGRLVVADRFVSSTLAYQGSAGGVPRERILDVARVACGDSGAPGSSWPDLTLIFDVSTAVAAERLHGSKKAFDEAGLFGDNMESRGRAFFEAVRDGYREQAELEPDRYAVIDASRSEDKVAEQVLRTLEERLVPAGAAERVGGSG